MDKLTSPTWHLIIIIMMDGDGDEEGPEDVFETGLCLLFDHPPVAHGDPTRPLVVSVQLDHGQSIDLVLDLPSTNHVELQAQHVWDASFYLLSILFPSSPSNPASPASTATTTTGIELRGKRVVELGAGAGLASVAAVRTGAHTVLATDFPDEQILSTLRRNLFSNPPSRACEREGGRRGVLGHEWGTSVDGLVRWNDGKRFDVVLAMDLIWRSSLHRPLIDSLVGLLEPDNGTAIVVSGLHSGRHVLDAFVDAVEARGMCIKRRWEVKRRVQGWEAYVRKEQDEQEEETRGVLVCLQVCIAT